MKNRSAFSFVLIIGIVNLFADLTYEGARGIVGPFLGSLGASAAIVGFVAGFGELMGYALRSVSGYFADKTHKYWAVAFTGYAINMLAVPALALAGQWPVAAGLVVAERTGRAIRKPVVEAMLSHAGRSIGAGWVFGLNEALDQAGATIGPLVVALILYLNGGYRTGFGVLLIPALLCLGILVVARRLHPRPHELEEGNGHTFVTTNLARRYWIYLGAGTLLAAGFADFALIGFHFHKANTVAGNLIPVFYAVAMASSALASIPLGRLFDSAFYREQEALDFSMDPYAKPKERKVGAQRPKITHLPKSIETRTRRERQAEKQAVAAERRAIKKSARRHLKRQLLEELKESE